MQRNLMAARRLSRVRGLAGVLSALLAGLALSACTSGAGGMRDYAGWANGENPCDACQDNWGEYSKVIRGVPPCAVPGDPCGTPCPPCAPPPPPPCPPPPCPPPPCPPMAGPAMGSPGMPPQARPGEAWCRVRVAPEYETITERVMTACPTTQRLWVPPCVETKVREVCVRPPCMQEIEVPGVYRTETYCCEIEPARTEQRPRPCTCEEQARGQCECYDCVTVPPCTQVRTRQICIQPPTRKVVYQPALYSTESVVCEKAPGFWKEVAVPGVWEQVSRVVCKTPERWEWRRNPTCTLPGAGEVPMPTAPPMPVPPVEPAPAPVEPPPVEVPDAPPPPPAPAPDAPPPPAPQPEEPK